MRPHVKQKVVVWVFIPVTEVKNWVEESDKDIYQRKM